MEYLKKISKEELIEILSEQLLLDQNKGNDKLLYMKVLLNRMYKINNAINSYIGKDLLKEIAWNNKKDLKYRKLNNEFSKLKNTISTERR